MNKSESLGDLAKAMAAFRAEMPDVTRNRTVSVKLKSGGSYSFDYATLDHILDLAVPVLSKHGLSVSQFVVEEGITTILMHESGQYLEGTTPFGRLSYSSAQDMGGIITYLRRYALSCVLGIASDEDDDANASVGNQAQAQPRKPQPRKAQPRKPATPETPNRQQQGQIQLGDLLNAAVAVGQHRKDVVEEAGKRFGTTRLEELSVAQMGELMHLYGGSA